MQLTAVGCFEGNVVGMTVGNGVGAAVGTTVGLADGAAVGLNDGDMVGAAAVGDAVEITAGIAANKLVRCEFGSDGVSSR